LAAVERWEKCGTPIVTSYRLSAIKNTAKQRLPGTIKSLISTPKLTATLVSLDLTVIRNSVQSSKDVCERRIRGDFMSFERREKMGSEKFGTCCFKPFQEGFKKLVSSCRLLRPLWILLCRIRWEKLP
jgi:hypothetical protein